MSSVSSRSGKLAQRASEWFEMKECAECGVILTGLQTICNDGFPDPCCCIHCGFSECKENPGHKGQL